MGLLWPIDTKLGACNQCNQNNDIIFSSLPSSISYSCLIKTWFRRIAAFLVFHCNEKIWVNKFSCLLFFVEAAVKTILSGHTFGILPGPDLPRENVLEKGRNEA